MEKYIIVGWQSMHYAKDDESKPSACEPGGKSMHSFCEPKLWHESMFNIIFIIFMSQIRIITDIYISNHIEKRDCNSTSRVNLFFKVCN